MKDFRWPQAFVIVGVLVALVALALLGKDSATVVVPALAILGALGFVIKQQAETKAETAAVKDQTNGNTKDLIAVIREQQKVITDLAYKQHDLIKDQASKMADMQPNADTTSSDQ